MPKYFPRVLVPALALAAFACGKGEIAPPPPPPPPDLNTVIPNLPKPPEGMPLSTESGADATQLTYITPLKPDSMIAYYRSVLAEPPFRLVSEQKVDGSTIFLAEQDGPGLWVTIRSDSAGGTSVQIAGGVNANTRDSSIKTKPLPTGTP